MKHIIQTLAGWAVLIALAIVIGALVFFNAWQRERLSKRDHEAHLGIK